MDAVTYNVGDGNTLPFAGVSSGALTDIDVSGMLGTISGMVRGFAGISGWGWLNHSGLPHISASDWLFTAEQVDCELISEDLDGDGFTIDEGDCDDNNPNINPEAEEICDGIDNDSARFPIRSSSVWPVDF